MFFTSAIRSRLLSSLQPWLLEQPGIELDVGFLHSHVRFEKLILDVSSLNRLIDGSNRLFLKEVRVEYLKFRVSPWSSHAFHAEVGGVHVIVGIREEERSFQERRNSVDWDAREMKEILALIDPEGSSLHEIIGQMLAIPPRNRILTTAGNTVLSHFQLRVNDIYLQMQLPISGVDLACFMKVKELNGEGQSVDSSCLFRGLVKAIFLPRDESSFFVNSSAIEIGLRSKEDVNIVASTKSLFTSSRLNNLQIAEFVVRAPQVKFIFSPGDLSSLMLAFSVFSPKEVENARSGQQLWRITARKISYLIPSWCRTVKIVLLWLRYIHAYESLLSLVGYSAKEGFKLTMTKMVHDRKFLGCVKHQWKVVSEIENELPIESVARARRICRHRAASHFHVSQSDPRNEVPITVWTGIIHFLSCVWKGIYCTFNSIMCSFLLLRGKISPQGEVGGSTLLSTVPSDGSLFKKCFRLDFGEISINLPLTPRLGHTVNGKMLEDNNLCYSSLLSFFFVVKAFCLTYMGDYNSQSLSLACGDLNIRSSSLSKTPQALTNSKSEMDHSLKGHREMDKANKIFWVEPAPQFCIPSKTVEFMNFSDSPGVILLEHFLGEMWSDWKNDMKNFEGNEVQYLEHPFLLFEIKNFLMDPYLNVPEHGLSKCSLALGKLNANLDCLSILSVASLLRQIQDAWRRISDYGVEKGVSVAPSISEELGEVKLEESHESLVSETKMVMLNLIPEKNLQFGVAIAGLRIQLSLQCEDLLGADQRESNHIIDHGLANYHFTFDIEKVEAALWPTSRSVLAAVTGQPELKESSTEYLRLEEPRLLHIAREDLNESYSSKGLIAHDACLRLNGINAFLEDLEEHRSQVVMPMSIMLRASSRRDYHHSLQSINALSMTSNGLVIGAAILLYLDELWAFVQALQMVLYAISLISVGGDHCSEIISNNLESPKHDLMNPPWSLKNTKFVIDGSLDIRSINIILDKSRKNHSTKNQMRDGGASASAFHCGFMPNSETMLALLDIPDYGVGVSVKQSCIQISCEEGSLEALIHLQGLDSVFFRYQNLKAKCIHESEYGNLLHRPVNCLYELSVSNLLFSIYAGHGEAHLTISNDMSEIKSGSSGQRPSQDQHAASNQEPISIYPILMNLGLDEISVAGSSLRRELIGAHKPNKLQFSLSIGADFNRVSCEIQGGLFILETTALATFIQCLGAYQLGFINFCSHISSKKQSEPVEAVVAHNTSLERRWKLPEVLLLRLSDMAIILAAADESGGACTLSFEYDFLLSLESHSPRKKIIFDLFRLTSFSQHLRLQNGSEQTDSGSSIPHFFSSTSNNSMTSLVSQKNYLESGVSNSELLNRGNCILKHGIASVVVEKVLAGFGMELLCPANDWVGNGSLSSFDLTITLSEIQMLLALVEPLYGVSNGETSHGTEVEKEQGHRDQRVNADPEAAIPDGAVVAIKDLHHHTYFAVEAFEDRFRLAGAIHYSLVGRRALFRVRYHTQRRWRSTISCFSLISLHATNDNGDPLRLNFCPGSAFVDISSTDDKEWALWQTSFYKPDSYLVDNDLEFYNISAKRAFSLVNLKNKCSVAFVDGLPEFVKKPGNPFKVKVFHEFPLSQEVAIMDVSSTRIGEKCETHKDNNVIKEEGSGPCTNLPYVILTIAKVTLTILDEVSGSDEMFPLLQGSIDNFQLILQISSSKTRLISSLTSAVYVFDARKNIWNEIISPIEASMFYSTKFAVQGSDTRQRFPSHLSLGMKQVQISLAELSLDILLFSVGKLNLAGPYGVKSSKIFANCCKVENYFGLSIICQFSDDKNVIIAAKQSTSIFLRRAILANQPVEKTSLLSVQLAASGSFSTSPIHISLLDAQVLAWRTRIASQEDSRTFPGPFLVVDISRRTEEGVSVVVSPLLRIHNESGFSMKLRFCRSQEADAESAEVLLRSGDTIDDSMAVFDALGLSGDLKRALMSMSLGNFILSFRPEIPDYFQESGKIVSVDWSEELIGGKPVRISGVFDKLNFRLKRALGPAPPKSIFSSSHCSLSIEGEAVSNIHFLIRTISREVPVIQPHQFGELSETRVHPIALQVQKEIFLLPTIQVSNLLQSEILVLLTESHPDLTNGFSPIGKQAVIPYGSSACFYANLDIIYFTVNLTPYNSKCKPVNSGDWIKKLNKQKPDVHHLDIELEFGGGKYFAFLRLSRGDKGILEATIYTSYLLQNGTDLSLFCFASNQKQLSWLEVDKYGPSLPPEVGCLLPPKSMKSWYLKSNKACIKRMEEKASEALLDMDVLSGCTDLCLEIQEEAGIRQIAKLGVSLNSCLPKVAVPSQIVSLVPRYVISNESKEDIIVHQCLMQDDMDGTTTIKSHQKEALYLRIVTGNRREISFFDSLVKKHRNPNEDSLIFIRIGLKVSGWSWSGSISIASLGRFFLKFKKLPDSTGYESNPTTRTENEYIRYAAIHTVEEGSSLILHFLMPPKFPLPYRIENSLSGASISYYQKDSMEAEFLESGKAVEYVWDDFSLPHKLVIQITDMHLSREINIDKVCQWKPFSKPWHTRGLTLHSQLEKKSGSKNRIVDESLRMEKLKLGYEVCADGLVRVLRICELPDSVKEDKVVQLSMKVQLRVSYLSIQLLEDAKQDTEANSASIYSPILLASLGNITLDSMFTDQYKFNMLKIQSLNVVEKWQGAPFAAMLRWHQHEFDDLNESVLRVVFTLHSTNSKVKQVKYSSIVLQPIDLNLDEETLMKLVAFWRTSLAGSDTPSQQFYFKHFEIHPIKIVASFLPGNPNTSYSSAQETLRTLLHGVIKIPAVKGLVVELNGVLLTHALLTARELLIKCAQHYSWYAMRAIYVAKGTLLLPPAFFSIFDDTASSSLDVFFDPSSGLVNLPGLTLGMFKVISKCIDSKGFSGTKRYFGDLGKTMKTAGSNVMFAATTEISDSILKGAETSGFHGMVNGFHQGILKLAMEPSLLGTAVMEGGPNRKIKLDRSPGIDEQYIEGYLQAMLDTMYKQEYLRVRVIDDQVILKNLPPNSSLINEIMEQVQSFLLSKGLMKGEANMTTSHPLRHMRGETEWRFGPTVLTLCEHLFVSFAIRMLHKQAGKIIVGIEWKGKSKRDEVNKESKRDEVTKEIVVAPAKTEGKFNRKWGITKFVLSGLLAYLDGRLCRHIPNPIARRIVSGFLLSFIDKGGRE